MKVAHIVPTRHLNMIGGHDYHMALAHVVLADREYANFYKKQLLQGKYVILDNGLIEKGASLSFAQVRYAASLIMPTHEEWEAAGVFGDDRYARFEVVMPDVFRDQRRSLSATRNALAQCVDRPQPWRRNVVVPHGANRAEWIDAFDELNAHKAAHVIALPKVLDEVWGYGGRFAAASFLAATGRVRPDKQYHLLGIWTDPLEIFLHSIHNPWIRGVDSALAFHSGYQGVSLRYVAKYGGDKPKRPDSYFDIQDLEVPQVEMIRSNIELLDRWAAGENR